MTWQNEMARILRYIINDIDASTYSDDRLEETLLIAAQLLFHNVEFDNTYTIDVDTLVLSPDPTTLSTKDNAFINLVIMKAACIILGSETKTLAAQAYRIKDGPSSIDIGPAYEATKQLQSEICTKLEQMIFEYRAGNSIVGHAIMTPYTQNGINTGYPTRNFY